MPDVVNVTGAEKELIRKALSGDRYLWRTPEGIAKETNLAPDRVKVILNNMDGVMHSSPGANHPNGLYALSGQYLKKTSLSRRLATALSGDLK